MKPYYQDEYATIYHADCREILPQLEPVDLVLTDPPYGIGLDTDGRRFSGGKNGHIGKNGNGIGTAGGVPITGGSEPFDPSFLISYGKNQVIWGWNHYPDKLPRGASLVWLKRYPEAFGSFLSDAEIAWMSKGHGVYCRLDLSNNAITRERAHPTQKPLTLMKWCLEFFPNAKSIIDPFAGSGTTLRAAKDLGIKSIGIEIEEKYCEIAAKRLKQEVLWSVMEASA